MTAERVGWMTSAALLAAFIIFALKHARAPGADDSGRARAPAGVSAGAGAADSEGEKDQSGRRDTDSAAAQAPARTPEAQQNDPDALDSTRLANAKRKSELATGGIVGVIEKRPDFAALDKGVFSSPIWGGGSESQADERLGEYARRARSSAMREFAPRLSAYKHNRKYPYVPILSLSLFPSRHLNKPVSAMGSAYFVNMQAAKPHFRLGDGHGVSASLPVDAYRLTKEQKITLMHMEGTHHLVGVFGTVKKTSAGEFFIEASALEDLGPFPTGASTVSQITDHPLNEVGQDRMTASTLARAKAGELQSLRSHRFIRTTEFILNPQAFQGQRISLMGVPNQPVNSPSGLHFEIADTFATQNKIEVLANRLTEAQKSLIFTLTFPPTVVALKGTVVQTRTGAVYVDADSIEAVSWWAHTSVEEMLNRTE